MPLFYQQYINEHTQLAIWKIEEDEDFFLEKVTVYHSISNIKKRLQHIAARYLLGILKHDFNYSNIEITENGKPLYQNNHCFFSLSHCANYAAAILSNEKNVGIDIELRENKVGKIMHKFLHDFEIEQVQELVLNKEFEDLPTILWSAKETLFKYYGKGNVDFKTMLKIDLHNYTSYKLNTSILMYNEKEEVEVFYKILDDLCLTFCIEKLLFEHEIDNHQNTTNNS